MRKTIKFSILRYDENGSIERVAKTITIDDPKIEKFNDEFDSIEAKQNAKFAMEIASLNIGKHFVNTKKVNQLIELIKWYGITKTFEVFNDILIISKFEEPTQLKLF